MFEVAVECSNCKTKMSPCNDDFLTVCPRCGGALLFQYDLQRIATEISKQTLIGREDTFWKFLEFLPLSSSNSIVSLGEPYTPMLQIDDSPTFKNVYLKDDGRLPTGTFKARGMAVTVSKLKELGAKRVAIPSAGNAASALAAYATSINIKVFAFLPKDVPDDILKECLCLGADVYLVDGLISHAAGIVRRLQGSYGWLDVSTSKQPYRFEGYKVIAFEMAEQFNWDLPDSVFFPTGGGEGVIGLWKGFKELIQLGWIEKIPRLIIVQSSGCAPLVDAYNQNQSEIKEPWKNPKTVAAGLRVPNPYASYLVLRAVRETQGMALAVEDADIISSMKTLFKKGIYACPEAASTFAALNKLQGQGAYDPDEKTLLYLTGTAMKYFDVIDIERDNIPVLQQDAHTLSNA